MELKKIGAFIADLRKEQGLTQAELAGKLGVSDKAVSRWETGKGLPDTSLLQPLSAQLGVSVEELLTGARIDTPEQKQTDAVLVDTLGYARRTLLQALWVLLLIVGAALILSPLYVLGGGFWPAGTVIFFTALLLLLQERRDLPRWLPPSAAMALLLLALVLEAIPGGAVLVFAPGPGEQMVQTFSYFSLTPFGYANFAPLLTALLTAAAVLLRAAALLWPRTERPARWGSICTLLALAFSLASGLLFGARCMNAHSWAVCGALAASAILQLRIGRQ